MQIITLEEEDGLVVLNLGFVGSSCETGPGNIKAANKMLFTRRLDSPNLAFL